MHEFEGLAPLAALSAGSLLRLIVTFWARYPDQARTTLQGSMDAA